MSMLPNVITQMIQTSVSVKRLAKFLSLEELNSHQIDQTPHKGPPSYIQFMVNLLVYELS